MVDLKYRIDRQALGRNINARLEKNDQAYRTTYGEVDGLLLLICDAAMQIAPELKTLRLKPGVIHDGMFAAMHTCVQKHPGSSTDDVIIAGARAALAHLARYVVEKASYEGYLSSTVVTIHKKIDAFCATSTFEQSTHLQKIARAVMAGQEPLLILLELQISRQYPDKNPPANRPIWKPSNATGTSPYPASPPPSPPSPPPAAAPSLRPPSAPPPSPPPAVQPVPGKAVQTDDTPGFIYCLSNPVMSVVKIGYTNRTVYDRLDELYYGARGNSATGVPMPFEVAKAWPLPRNTTRKTEEIIHTRLDAYRVKPGRGKPKEFFRLTPAQAIAHIDAILIELGYGQDTPNNHQPTQAPPPRHAAPPRAQGRSASHVPAPQPKSPAQRAADLELVSKIAQHAPPVKAQPKPAAAPPPKKQWGQWNTAC